MKQSLICFDPGGTTGWCRFKRTFSPQWHVDEFGQFPLDRIETISELINPGELVIYEQIHALHLGFDPVGLEVIGAIKLTCHLGGNGMISQSPGNLAGAKAWKELDEARKWFRTQPHAKDAFYHGVTYLGLAHVDLSAKPLRST